MNYGISNIGGKTKNNELNKIFSILDKKNINSIEDYVATSPISDALAKELKKRGFKFLGSTTLYSHLQATGLINDLSLIHI